MTTASQQAAGSSRAGVGAGGGGGGNGRPEIVETYDYKDESGVLRYQVVRYEPKDFNQRRPFDGADSWAWGLAEGTYRKRYAGCWTRLKQGETRGPGDRDLRAVEPLPYRLPELLLADHKEWVFIVEGERKVNALRAAGLVATCNSGGAEKWRGDFSYFLRGRKVCVIPDNDDKGRRHARMVVDSASALASVCLDLGPLPGVGPKGDVCDWMARCNGTGTRLLEMAEGALLRRGSNGGGANGQARQEEGGGEDSLALTALEDVQILPVCWLIPDFLPQGKLTLLAGDGGYGKSTLTLHIAAALSRGECALGRAYTKPASPARTLLVSCEDDLADTVVPRLLSMGADLGFIRHVDGIKTPGGAPAPFCLDHVRAVERDLLEHPETRLIVIDPAVAYVGRSKVDDHKDSSLRALLAPLGELAAKMRVAVVLVVHLNKGNAQSAVKRIGASVGYVNAARHTLLAAPYLDGQDPAKDRILMPLKSNLSPNKQGVVYRAAPLPPAETEALLDAYGKHLDEEQKQALAKQLYRLEFSPQMVDASADEMVADPKAPGGRRQKSSAKECAEWLVGFLGRHAWPDSEAAGAAEAAGYTERSYRDAKTLLRNDRAGSKLHSKPRGPGGSWWIGTLPPSQWVDRPEPPAAAAATGGGGNDDVASDDSEPKEAAGADYGTDEQVILFPSECRQECQD